MTNLRQIANHPFIKVPPTGDEVTEDVVNYSGKMMLLDRILPELIARGHKVRLSLAPLSQSPSHPSRTCRSSSSRNSPRCSTSCKTTSRCAK